MTQTASTAALLHVAVQDLHAGKRLQQRRLPAIAAAAGEALAAVLNAEATRARLQADRIEALGVATSGPANLWMGGILDDADRDARSHQAGRLRDIALVGAIRKAKAAEIVSSDTALALAAQAAVDAIEAAIRHNREEEVDTDTRLRALLRELTQ